MAAFFKILSARNSNDGYVVRFIMHEKEIKWTEKIAESAMSRHSKYMEKWCYELGLILKAIEAVYHQTGNIRYFNYIKEQMDRFIESDGAIKGYDQHEYNLDLVNPGRTLLFLYEKTHEKKYRIAAHSLHEQLKKQPRNHKGGFWHKGIYPHQMWLDGLYMSSPFYAQYAGIFNETEAYDDVLNQIMLLGEHTRDPHSGLLYHAWDESKGMKWSNDETGCSPHFWGRAVGWYMMALVDILDYFPTEHPGRPSILQILKSAADALEKVQDKATGVWFQVLDRAKEEGNYLEASASCMFTYALYKGVRMGYLDTSFMDSAERAYKGIFRQFVETDGQGCVDLKSVCSVAGLGGNPYRDGSLAYYFSEPVATNDYKGYGPFLLASVEHNY